MAVLEDRSQYPAQVGYLHPPPPQSRCATRRPQTPLPISSGNSRSMSRGFAETSSRNLQRLRARTGPADQETAPSWLGTVEAPRPARRPQGGYPQRHRPGCVPEPGAAASAGRPSPADGDLGAPTVAVCRLSARPLYPVPGPGGPTGGVDPASRGECWRRRPPPRDHGRPVTAIRRSRCPGGRRHRVGPARRPCPAYRCVSRSRPALAHPRGLQGPDRRLGNVRLRSLDACAVVGAQSPQGLEPRGGE